MKTLTSQRSSVLSRLDEISDKVSSVANLSGSTYHRGGGYPPWEPNWESPLLAKCKVLYKKRFGKEPIIEVIHAGLECGIIGDKYPGMDMISIGPTIKNPHSPDECLKITDIDKIWDVIVDIFESL
jgi:dipeptidase D